MSTRLTRLLSVALPLALCVFLPLSVYLRGRASGDGFGPSAHDALMTSALTWAAIDLLLVSGLLVLQRGVRLLVLPPVVASLIIGSAWLLSGQARGGLLDVRLIDLVNLPASLVLDGASGGGRAAAETTTGLTFLEARTRGFSTSIVSIAAVGDGALVLGSVALHHQNEPILGRVFGLDANGQPRATFGERLDLPSPGELLLVANATRTALLHGSARFGVGTLKFLTAEGKQEGPTITGATALWLGNDDQPWVAHRDSSGPAMSSLVSRVIDEWPRRVVELAPADGADRPLVLALRGQTDGTGVLVAAPTPGALFRADFSSAGLQNKVELAGDGEATAAGLDAAGRVVVYRPHAREPWARYLPDGALDTAFRAPTDLKVSAFSVADSGAVWMIAQRAPPASEAILRLKVDGTLDPAVSFEAAPAR